MATDYHWRPAGADDLAAMIRIADIVHPDYPEDPAIFAERLALHPEGVLVVANGAPGGYVLIHPWMLGRPPSLNRLLGAVPADADTYYLHDIALLPDMRGRGLARAAIEALVDRAGQAGLRSVSLVSVIGEAYWQAFGFRDASARIAPGKLASYGADARYMVRDIDGD
ncbi:MAG: GNAT family N-acetyltransferase [Bauldia litoralis]